MSGADTSIAICPPGPDMTPGGKDTGITLEGVPPMFWLRDPEGNTLLVVEGGS
jgi:hypothetical protein